MPEKPEKMRVTCQQDGCETHEEPEGCKAFLWSVIDGLTEDLDAARSRLAEAEGERDLAFKNIEYATATIRKALPGASFMGVVDGTALLAEVLRDSERRNQVSVCAYCGHESCHDGDKEKWLAQILAHMEECPKHPVKILMGKYDAAESRAAGLEGALREVDRLCSEFHDFKTIVHTEFDKKYPTSTRSDLDYLYAIHNKARAALKRGGKA